MGIFINNKLNNIEKIKYENDIKTYSGFYNNYFENKTIDVVASGTSFTDITFNPNNGYIIGIGYNSTSGTNNILTSSDGGESWSSHKYSETTSFKDIIFADDKYIAVGDNGKIIYSLGNAPSGTSNWLTVNNSFSNNLTSITYGNGYYVITSNSGNNRVFVSNNGINWNIKNIENKSWTNSCYSSDLKTFVIVSSDSYISYSRYNGNEWSTISLDGSWSSIAWSSKLKMFVIVGNSGTNRMVYSYDGINWTINSSIIISDWSSVIWSQELEIFIAVSASGKIITSPDGLNWTNRNSESSNYRKIIWNNYYGNLIIVSSNSTSIKIITNKSLGINSLLPIKKYYYNDNSFYYSQNDILMSVGNDYYFYPNLNENLGFTYSISPSLPIGLSLNSRTGEIKGSVYFSLNKTRYKITAINSEKTLKTYIYISISGVSVGLSNFYYISNNSISFDVNSEVLLIPKISGTLPITYSNIGPTYLPNNIKLNSSTGIISGISSSTYSIISYTIRATNILGSIDNTITITTNDKVPDSFNYNNGSSINLGTNQTSITPYPPNPLNNKGTNLIYSIDPPFNNTINGLNINSSTGIISGSTPSTPKSQIYNVKASNNNNLQFKNYSLTINVLDLPPIDFSYNSGTNVITTNNNLPFSYSPTTQTGSNLIWSSSPALPNGITLNQNGVISGFDMTITNTTSTFYYKRNYTITCQNLQGSKSTVITLQNIYFADARLNYSSGSSLIPYDIARAYSYINQPTYSSLKAINMNNQVYDNLLYNGVIISAISSSIISNSTTTRYFFGLNTSTTTTTVLRGIERIIISSSLATASFITTTSGVGSPSSNNIQWNETYLPRSQSPFSYDPGYGNTNITQTGVTVTIIPKLTS
jgi:hypothetical protein